MPDARIIAQQIRLQRRPFATIADAVERVRVDLDLGDITSAWYVSYQRGSVSDATEHFHYVAGRGVDVIGQILKAENSTHFTETVDRLVGRVARGTVEGEAMALIKTNANPTAFVSSVLSLVYSFEAPLQFLEGRVHEKSASAVRLIELHRSDRDRVHQLPLMRFADELEFSPQSDAQPDLQLRALTDWLLKITPQDEPPWVICVPVLGDYRVDDTIELATPETVRGYYSIGCADEAAANRVIGRLCDEKHRIRKRLNRRLSRAVLEGMRNYVLSSYPSGPVGSEDDLVDPISFWIQAVRLLEPWELTTECRFNRDGPHNKDREGVCISIGQLIDLGRFSGEKLLEPEEIDRLAKTYSDRCLHLRSDYDRYLDSSVDACTSLLNDLLQKRQTHVQRGRVLGLARSAAVSAVMSRNMSHNLGSHVLARATTGDISPATGETNKAQLLTYLRTRMDFLADVATGVPTSLTPKRLWDDVLEPFDEEVLLKKYVSGTSLQRIGVVALDRNGDPLHSGERLVGIANDTLGDHAFYVILENLIRNTAKHGKVTRAVDVFVRFGEVDTTSVEEGRLIPVTVFDSMPVDGQEIEKLVQGRNLDIQSSILDGGRLRSRAWGMLEMKIAAGYLRRRDPADIDTPREPPLLEACDVLHRGSHHLGYCFYLPTYQLAKVLFFSKGAWGAVSLFAGEFHKIGVDISAVDSGSATAALDTVSLHDFLVLVDPTPEAIESVKRLKSRLPTRLGIISNTHSGSFGAMLLPGFLESLRSAASMVGDEPERAFSDISAYLWKHCTENRFGSERLPELVVADCDKESGHRHTWIGEAIPTGTEAIPVQAYVFDVHGTCKALAGTSTAWSYWEPHGSSGLLARVLRSFPGATEQQQTQLMYQLLEAARLRVAVVDERVQARGQDMHPQFTRSTAQVLADAGISIPPVAIDLNKPHFHDSLKESIASWIDEQFAREHCVDVLVIHLTIIEKLTDTSPESIRSWIETLRARHALQASFGRDIIVTSGRGKPPNLPDDVRFVHLSALLRYLFEDRSKLHLARLIASSRPTT